MKRSLVLATVLLACHPTSPRAEAGAGAGAEAKADAKADADADAKADADADAKADADADADPSAGRALAALGCLARWYAGTVDAAGRALVLPDGTRVPYDDGRAKTPALRIDAPDVEDVFAAPYRAGPIRPVTDEAEDPGRARIEALFRATYGRDASEVSAALVTVELRGLSLRVHRRAADPLRRVAARLDAAVRADPALGPLFSSSGGTFATRSIAGTERTSAHAWGIAVDLDPRFGDYWRNAPGDGGIRWRNRVPRAVVDAFEAEGFAWGGRWFHYDTMHFEYRPELFDPSCRRD